MEDAEGLRFKGKGPPGGAPEERMLLSFLDRGYRRWDHGLLISFLVSTNHLCNSSIECLRSAPSANSAVGIRQAVDGRFSDKVDGRAS